MPSLKSIERFKERLTTLGHEPEILTGRGETPSSVPVPEEGVPEDLNELLGGFNEEQSSTEEEFVLPEEDLSEEEAGMEEGIIPSETPPEVSEEAAEEFDIEGIFPEGATLGAPESESLGEEGSAGEEQPPEAEEPIGEEPLSEEFSLPEGFEATEPSNEFSLPETFEIPEESAEAEIPEEPQPEASWVSESPIESPGEEEGSKEPETSEEMTFFDESEARNVGEGHEAGETGLSPRNKAPSKPAGEEFSIPEGFPFEEGGGEEKPIEEELGIPKDFGAGEDFDLDEFNLGTLGAGFGLGEETAQKTPETEEELNPASAVPEDLVIEEVTVSEADFDRITKNLARLPRNVKIAVEELIGEKGLSGDRLKTLLGLLIRGAQAAEVAAYVGTITGRRLKVPAQYEKRTGEEFEAVKETFAYNFRKNVLPLLMTGLAGAIVLAMFGFLSYRFVYKPLRALSIYNAGYKAIGEDNFTEANELFDEASSIWLQKRQFYRYAEAFIDKRQFSLAEQKYERLLTLFPSDKKGTLDYARLEWSVLSRYEQAIRILKRYLDLVPFDYDAILMQGDVYLDWGDEEKSHYEDARFAYATLIEKNGVKTELLFRMLKYFIRTDNEPEVERLKDFFQADKKLKVDPGAYAELGGYLIDKSKLDDVRDILFRALAVNERMPELHYQLARFYLKLKDPTEESKALDFAITFFEDSKPLSKKQLTMLIDALRRKGENCYAKKDYLVAEESFTKAIDLYTDARDRNILTPSPVFGKIFADLGDIYYYVGDDLSIAYSQFSNAEENGYSVPELSYKKGYILYDNEDYGGALSEFTKAAGNYSKNLNLAYATANAFFMRNDHGSAEGFYRDILRKLLQKRALTENFRPEEREDHRIIVENTMKVYNNLGVTLHALWYKTGDNAKFSESLVCFTKALEIYDNLMRNTESLERSETKSIPLLNQMHILYPQNDYILQLYDSIPKDMDALAF